MYSSLILPQCIAVHWGRFHTLRPISYIEAESLHSIAVHWGRFRILRPIPYIEAKSLLYIEAQPIRELYIDLPIQYVQLFYLPIQYVHLSPYLPLPHVQLSPYLSFPYVQLSPYLPFPYVQLSPCLPFPYVQLLSYTDHFSGSFLASVSNSKYTVYSTAALHGIIYRHHCQSIYSLPGICLPGHQQPAYWQDGQRLVLLSNLTSTKVSLCPPKFTTN